jgi:hypothetical protein
LPRASAECKLSKFAWIMSCAPELFRRQLFSQRNNWSWNSD